MGNKIDQLCKRDISIKRHNYYYCTKFTLQIRITLERHFFHLAIKDQVYANPTLTPTASPDGLPGQLHLSWSAIVCSSAALSDSWVCILLTLRKSCICSWVNCSRLLWMRTVSSRQPPSSSCYRGILWSTLSCSSRGTVAPAPCAVTHDGAPGTLPNSF
jgi:hypothetical protein